MSCPDVLLLTVSQLAHACAATEAKTMDLEANLENSFSVGIVLQLLNVSHEATHPAGTSYAIIPYMR